LDSTQKAFETTISSPRSYSTQRNAEHINEIVAGVRWSFLTETQASPSFTKIVDFFSFPASYNHCGGADGLALHVVQEQHANNLQFFFHFFIKRVPDLVQLNMVRSLLAQVLLALENAQSLLRATHYDLHIGNVMLKDPAQLDDDAWCFQRPNHRPSFYLDPNDLKGKQAVLIDFGRSRIDHPYHPGDDRYAAYVELCGCPPSKKFDPFVDARAFAHDFTRYILFPWTEHFVRIGSGSSSTPRGSPFFAIERECEQLLEELYGVLEAMMGLRSFEGWNKNGDLSEARMGPVPRTLHQLLTYFPDGHTKVSRIRTNEFFFSREERGFTPTEILSMPFFGEYLREKPNHKVVAQPRSFRARSRDHRTEAAARDAKIRK